MSTNDSASVLSTQTTQAQEIEKITFSQEQQARIDEIVKASMGRAGREAREEAATLREQIEAMTANPDKRVADLEAELRNRDSKIAALSIASEAIQAARTVERAALRAGLLNPDDVGTLLAKHVKIVDGKANVVTAQGVTRYNRYMQPMTVDEMINEFTSTKPYYLPGQGDGSSERTQSARTWQVPLDKVFGRRSEAKTAAKLMREHPQEYARMKIAAREEGLID